MINLLIADDDIFFTKTLANYLLTKNKQLRLENISTNGEEVIQAIQKNEFDIILLDINMPKKDGMEVIEDIEEMHLRKIPKIIVVTGFPEKIGEVAKKKMVVDYSIKSNSFSKIQKQIKNLMECMQKEEVKTEIVKELTKIGYNPKHLGTQYLIDSIQIMKEVRQTQGNLEKDIYPQIAKKYQTTVDRVKDNIIKATNYMYLETKMDLVNQYFSIYEDEKPTPKLVISTVLQKIT